MEAERRTPHRVPRFLRKVDIKVIFSDRNVWEHRKKELQPIEQVYSHGYQEADPEQAICEDTPIGRNLKRDLDNRIRQLFVFYPLLADDRG